MNIFEKRMTDMENGMIASKLMKKNDEQYECENLKELIYGRFKSFVYEV